MNKLDTKYKACEAFDRLNTAIDTFNLDWKFKTDKVFDRIAQDFINLHGKLNKDVFYIFETDVDYTLLEKMRNRSTIDFSNGTSLQKVDDYFLYHNKYPLVFGVHIHLHHNEELTPLKNDVIIYILKGNTYERIDVKVGETFISPKGVKHAALFSKPNMIKLQWK